MKTKHTQGEWKVDSNVTTKVFSLRSADVKGGLLCTEVVDTKKLDHKVSEEEAEANAKLIAAAPDLLKALLRCERVLDIAPIIGKDDLVDHIKQAIKKATS